MQSTNTPDKLIDNIFVEAPYEPCTTQLSQIVITEIILKKKRSTI